MAECFWSGVNDADLAMLDRRIDRVITSLGTEGAVRYLGSILMRDDEVVLCQFDGLAKTVRDVVEQAEIPFERLLATTHSPWPLSRNGGPR